MPQRVLVLGDDAKAFLAVVRSLGRKGVEVHAAPVDFASPALSSRYLSAVHRLPPYPLGAEAWADSLGALIARRRIGLVIPTSDSSLLMLLRHAQRLGRERLALPNERAAEIFTDKAHTRRLAFETGVPVCPGRLIGPDDSAAALAAAFGLPLVLKPRRSWSPDVLAGKRQARIVRSVEALDRALAEGMAGEWVVESFFVGAGIGVSVLANKGVLLAAIQHRRTQEEHETGPSTRRVTEPLSPRLLACTRALAEGTGLTGVAMFEYRWDHAQDDHVLLEVNPRFWGSLPLALAAGADFPAMLRALHSGGDPAALAASFAYSPGRAKADLEGEYHRLVGRIQRAGTAPRRLATAAAALAHLPRLCNPAAFDSWTADDPEPFVEERRLLLARLGAAAAKRLPMPGPVRLSRSRRLLRRAMAGRRAERVRLLVVGAANVCRSPFAEQLLRARVTRAGAALEIVSAGTLPVENRPPSSEAVAAAARFGVDLSGHRSRSLTPAALAAASAVIVFDHDTAERLRAIEPELNAAVLRLPDLTDARDIADPCDAGVSRLLGEFHRISESVAALAAELGPFLPVT